MKYNFDKVHPRKNTDSVKYDELTQNFNTDNVLPVWIADMDFEVAPEILEAMKQRLKHPIFGYPSRPIEYYKAFIDWHKRRNNFDIKEEEISYTVNVVKGLQLAVETFTKPGDKILVQPPVYFPFYDVINATGRKIIQSHLVNKDNYYTIDFIDFENKLKDGVKAFIFCSPHNPVGRVWKKEELLKIKELTNKYNVLVLSDEIHSDLILYNNTHIPYQTIDPDSIAFYSTAKTFNLSGLQSSYVVIKNKEMNEIFNQKLMDNFDLKNNAFSIVANIAAHTKGDRWLSELIKYLEENIEITKDFFKKYIPNAKITRLEATYLLWIDFSYLNLKGDDFIDTFINKGKIAVNPGGMYCSCHHSFIRFNIGMPKELLYEALERIKKAVT